MTSIYTSEEILVYLQRYFCESKLLYMLMKQDHQIVFATTQNHCHDECQDFVARSDWVTVLKQNMEHFKTHSHSHHIYILDSFLTWDHQMFLTVTVLT